MYALRQELAAEAGQQAAALTERRERAAKLAAELEAADLAASAAHEAVEAARRADAAAGLAQTLHVGDDCPVCRQRIQTLPAHEAPADLAAAGAALDRATAAQRQARKAHADADKTAASAASELDGTQRRLAKAAEIMAAVSPLAELAAQLTAIEAADNAVAAARAAASASVTEFAAAERARESLTESEQGAWAALRSARDHLVTFGAPALETPDLAAAWDALVSWASAQATLRTKELAGVEAAAAKLSQQAGDAAAGIARLLGAHDVPAEPLSRAPAAVADQRARADAALQKVRQDRAQAVRLDEQIAAHREEAQVAAMLGALLRANSFERWLCSEALDSLVQEASATLLELSGNQYELDRDERNDLVVIDYADAGARRPVHTLSGGETFQASLALALALSRQVISLSAGKRQLNSMFLDEGFGTLDSDTLDTVASTLERLAADSDRMVGVITHVPTLAERVPVRFVVSRTGTTSTIVRERL